MTCTSAIPPFGDGLSKNCLCFALRPRSQSLLGSIDVDVDFGAVGLAFSVLARIVNPTTATAAASALIIVVRRKKIPSRTCSEPPVDGLSGTNRWVLVLTP